MSTDIENKSFADIIKDRVIRIPKIQRDYAQGRKQKDVEEIRNQFVRSLLLVVTGKRPFTQLDFVYGSDRRNAFEPLDGQQRLTTLFILHWMLDYNLQTENGESVLTYETRNTSAAFCKELVKHHAKDFIDEADFRTEEEKRIAKEEKNKPLDEQDNKKLKTNVCTPSQILKKRDWFQWGWNFDPTINSMLVMIDTINSNMDWSLDLTECKSRLSSITFNHLDLGELGMSDELFIKMNARGKLLSDFDRLKSTIEEEIQIQQQELDIEGNSLADQDIEKNWRKYMDGAWIDLFWQQTSSTTMSKPISEENKIERLKVAKLTEKKMKIFILRMIALQLFSRIPMINNEISLLAPKDDNELALTEYYQLKETIEKLYEASYQIKSSNLDYLLLAYQNQLIDCRSNDSKNIPSHCITINFKELINDINLWIVNNGNGSYCNVTSLLPIDTNFDNSTITYFERLSSDDLGNDVAATIYAMLNFLKAFPYQNNSNAWLTNFEEWTRLARNIFNNDNNTRRIDKRLIEEQAFDGISKITSNLIEFMESNKIDLYTDSSAILQFIKSINVDYIGIDNQSLAEEVSKAKLRMSDDKQTNALWSNAIRNAEKNPYLWGQIRCLIHWADGNLEKFNDYSKNLISWINLDKQWSKQELYYNAMLCMQPDCWKKTNNRLYEFNRNRDNSIKRYLRDEPYGENVKQFVDEWIKWNKNASFEDFCIHVIDKTENSGWVAFFKTRPSIIWQSWRKKIFTEKGHVIFAQQQTTDSHCIDPILFYLKGILEDKFYHSDTKNWTPGIVCNFYDSKSLGSHCLEISCSEHLLTVKWGEKDSEYVITEDGKTVVTTSIDDLVSKSLSIFNVYSGYINTTENL